MRRVKLVTITLAIILITMIAFFGIYVPVQNRMENKVKDYSYAMDLKGSRNIQLKLNTENKTTIKDSEGNVVEDTEGLTDEQIAEKGYTKEETPYNADEAKTVENYKASQKIIEKRLKKLGVNNYIIKLDEATGDIVIELPENGDTDRVVGNIDTTGKFEIVDSETQEVLMNNDDIKQVKVMYGSDSNTTNPGTAVYLEINFDKEGAKKLEEISNTYKSSKNTETEDENTQNETTESETAENETEDENTQDETTEGETAEKKISMKIDDREIMTTSFDETIQTGKMQLSIGSATTDPDALQDYMHRASIMATILDGGKMPLVYELSDNQYILSNITNDEIQVAGYVVLAIIAISLIVLIIRYKTSGLLGAISFIGLVALLTIIIRYTNVVISLEGLLAGIVILILNYLFVNYLLKSPKTIKEIFGEFIIKIIPIIIMAVTFCFVNWTPISSFGMVMFWGIALMIIYNILVTNYMLKIKEGKEK